MVVGGARWLRFRWVELVFRDGSERSVARVDVALVWSCGRVVLRALAVVVATDLFDVVVFGPVQVVFEGVVDVDDGLVGEWRGRIGSKAAAGGHVCGWFFIGPRWRGA